MYNYISLHQTLIDEVNKNHGIDLKNIIGDDLKSYPVFDKSLLQALDNNGASDDDRILALLSFIFRSQDPGICLRDVRTALCYTYKVKVAPSKEQHDKSYQSFAERNDRCRFFAQTLSRSLDPTSRRPRGVFGQILEAAAELCKRRTQSYKEPDLPAHGPGTSFYGEDLPYRKFESLERDVPEALKRFSSWFVPSPSWKNNVGLSTDAICRLSSVPKDARGPRLIAPHLVSQMWMQQAVASGIQRLLTRQERWFKHHLPTGERLSTIQFEDQSVNSTLALYASGNPEMYATLDLSDASDLVSWSLVAFLFRGTRLIHDLGAVRARYVKTPLNEKTKLYMHAPMGSCTCFPVLSVVVWALACAIINVVRYGESAKNQVHVSDIPPVFVFGDDIILPTEFASDVMDAFELFGLRPNKNKSYVGSGFRESCGCDAYKGIDITPVRLKVGGVSSIQDIASLVAHVNSLRNRGFTRTAGDLLLALEVEADRLGLSAALCATDDPLYTCCIQLPGVQAKAWNIAHGVRMRYNHDYQRHEALGLVKRWKRVNVREDLDSRCRLMSQLIERPVRGWVGNDSTVVTSFVPVWQSGGSNAPRQPRRQSKRRR